MKRKVLLTAIVLISLFFIPISRFSGKITTAQENEEEAATISGEKIEEIRKEIQKRVEEKLNQIADQVQKRAWIGTVEEKGETSLKLKSRDEEIRTISISEDVKVINKNRKEIGFDNLETGQRIIAMGYLQADATLEAKRIVVIPEPKKRERKAVFGMINNKSEEEEIISVAGNNEENYEIVLTQKTVLRKKAKGEMEKIKYQDLEAGQKIIAVLTPTEGNGSTFNAKLILVFPSASAKPDEKTEE